MVKQEIEAILEENKDSIKEIVETSLAPELRAAIRETISALMEASLKESSEPEGQEQVVNRESPHLGEMVQDPEPDSKKELGNRLAPIRNDTDSIKTGGENGSGRYLYCVAVGDKKTHLGKIGIEDSEVYTIPYKNLCAVIHDCRAEPYQSEDEALVKQWVLTHQKVVDAAWETFGTIIPIGFDTIIRGNSNVDPDENMRQWLNEEYENLKRKMDKIIGKAEYGVQVFWDSEIMARKITLQNNEVNQINSEIQSKPKGMAYMYRQKLEKILKTEMEREADQSFKELYEKIKPFTHDLKIEKTKKAEDKNQRMLLNLSCLLSKGKSKNLGDELEKIDSKEGFRVRFTGPWPPYSFV